MQRRQFINGLATAAALTTASIARPARASTSGTTPNNVQIVTPEQFGAVADYDRTTDTGTDNTPYFAQAVSYLTGLNGGIIKMGAGNYLGRFVIEDPCIQIVGEGEWVTSLYNVDNNPAILISNQKANNQNANLVSGAQYITISDLAICNRNPTAWPNSDGIAIQGTLADNQCGFLTFKNLYIYEMQNGISIVGRTIWNTYDRVHIATSLLNGISVNATDNCGAQTFNMCRIAYCQQHGIFVDTGFPTFPVDNWSFYNTTIEHNYLNGVRITGTQAGIQAWLFSACYMEENTYGITSGDNSGLMKAHVFIDCPNIFGLTFDTCTLFGSSGTNANLDYNIYANTTLTTVAYGEIKNTRFGVSNVNDVYWPAGVLLGMNEYTSTTNIDRSKGSLDIRDITQASTSFVPSLAFGEASQGITYSNQVGRYSMHGNVVYFEIYVSITGKGTSSGAATIEGLPFATSSTTNLIPTFAVHADQFSSDVTQVMARTFPGSTSIQINRLASGTAAPLTDADFGNYSALSVSGHYFWQ